MKIRYIIYVILIVFLIHPVYADNALRERVYVQTDKQTYISGELLWLKFYLTDEKGKPSSFSKIGYVELLNESAAEVQAKIDLVNGIGEGWMELPASLPTGNYRLTAYTRNMRNEEEKVFFNKTIAVINTFKADAFIEIDEEGSEVAFSPISEGNISVSAGKQSYTIRSQGEINIQGLPENIHSMSISVTGKDLVTSNDNILKWHNQLPEHANTQLKNDFLPEYEGHIVQGNIIDAVTNLAPAGTNTFSLLGFVGNQIRVSGGLIDKDYNVQYIMGNIAGVKEFAIANITQSDNNYRVNIQSPFVSHSEKTLPEFKLNPAWEEQLLQRSVGLQVLYSFFTDSMSRVDTTYAYFQWKPNRPYVLDEYTRFTTMEEVVIEYIPPLRFRHFNNRSFLSVLMLGSNNVFSSGNTLVLLDGVPILDHGLIYKYNPLSIHRIDIYQENYVFGNRLYEGIVSFTTYKNNYPGLVLDESTRLYDYEGTLSHRYFYAPVHSEESGIDSRIPDYRHTLLWMPEVKTNGQPTLSIPFSTSDLTGDFQITIEGITKDGKIVRGTSFFDVKD